MTTTEPDSRELTYQAAMEQLAETWGETTAMMSRAHGLRLRPRIAGRYSEKLGADIDEIGQILTTVIGDLSAAASLVNTRHSNSSTDTTLRAVEAQANHKARVWLDYVELRIAAAYALHEAST